MADLEEFTLEDGSVRKLGCLMPDPTMLRASRPVFGDAVTNQKMIARSEWADLMKNYSSGNEDQFLPPIHDQGPVGQCCPESAVTMVEYLRARQGLGYVRLSGADLYHRINRGVDQGSLLEDALRELTTNGVGTAATSGTIWKNGVWKGEASSAERKRFRVLEWYECPTFDHIMSALFAGFVVQSGTMWYQSHFSVDQDGWLPPRSGQAGGHAYMSYRPAVRVVGGKTVYGTWNQNSWGESWPKIGLKGRFAVSEELYNGPVGGWWALRGVVDDGGVVPPVS